MILECNDIPCDGNDRHNWSDDYQKMPNLYLNLVTSLPEGYYIIFIIKSYQLLKFLAEWDIVSKPWEIIPKSMFPLL